MNEVKFPNWRDVGVPNALISTIRNMPPCFLLDTLVYQLIFHYTKKLQITYHCEVCGYQYVPTRSTEEVAQCINCGKRRVFSTQEYIFPKDKVPLYSRNPQYNILDIIYQMDKNYIRRWKQENNTFDWNWSKNYYEVQFCGGDSVQDPAPRQAVIKAAVLVPYLWDSMFDWDNDQPREVINQKYFSHLFNQWTSKGWRKQ